MTSAVEQLVSNINFKSVAKAAELKQRLWFTLLALIVFRLGTHIPLPGVDPAVWQDIFSQKSGGMLDMFNLFSGGALQRMSVLALSITPYISASIIMSLVTEMMPSFKAMKKDGGESGRKRLNQYTRYLTIVLASVQAWGMAVGLENMQSHIGAAVSHPGMFFRIMTVTTVLSGTFFLMWLGDQITTRGVGNGNSLIIFAGIVAGIPHSIFATLELANQNALHPIAVVALLGLIVGVVAFVVFMERANRRVIVHYPKRMVGNRIGGEASHMPLKLNMTGVIPPIFASSLLFLPMTIVGLSGDKNTGDWLDVVARFLQHGSPIYMSLYAGLIVFFTFFYTAIQFNPDETAENLRKQGGFVPGIRPGKSTADYLDYILTRITLVGAGYLCLVCLLPEFLISKFSLPFYLGGTSVLIAVSVPMDTIAQIQSHLMAHQYEGLIKKAKLRGAKR